MILPKNHDELNWLQKIKNILSFAKETFYPMYEDRWFNHVLVKHFTQINKKEVIGVEIGVDNGFHAFSMIRLLEQNGIKVKKLILIDPYTKWTEFINNKYVEHDYSLHKHTALKTLAKYKDKLEFIYKTSDDAMGIVRDEVSPDGADFIYIDANHNYEFVRRDLQNYYPFVTLDNGIFGGHDFCAHWQGVARAVMEFADYYNLDIFGKDIDWWFIKNG